MRMPGILLLIVRRGRAIVVIAAIAPILMLGVALSLAPSALAQTAPAGSALSGAGDAAPPAAADPPADAPIDGVAPIAAAGDASASDDSAERHSGWVRSGDEDEDGGEGGSVLELPRVAPDAEAQSAGEERRPAPSDASPPPDQVGSLGDYQDDDDYDFGGIYYLPVGGLGGPGAYGLNLRSPSPAFRPNYMPTPRSAPNMSRPGLNGNGMNAAIGSTSPMMPEPGNLSPMPGGWAAGGR